MGGKGGGNAGQDADNANRNTNVCGEQEHSFEFVVVVWALAKVTSDSSWSDNNNSGDIIFCLVELCLLGSLLCLLLLLQLLVLFIIIERLL